ncbi:MAG: septum formation inhibitor Maf [Gammaproteobacteria bacterium]|nr:septum formation inhibitor Maf [Gammaproteobacteria bacterium]MCP5137184.1 septum formation inhibitor Maf [Gammaproteobacteria bacterium]
MQLVLASTSPFRRELLSRLQVPFDTFAPDIDEKRRPDESAITLVRRLAKQKAAAAKMDFPEALVIGSDQVAVLGSEILGKPHTHDNAVAQLKAASGKRVVFQTGLCLLNTATGHSQVEVIPFTVEFRRLTDTQIDNYLRAEQPYRCAGSFKSEALGVALFERMEGDDPTSLIGLPLIRLTRMLEREGLDILDHALGSQA